MPTIRVDTDKLERMCLHLDYNTSTLRDCSANLFRAVYGAPSYDGQYGPWLWGLAEEGSASLHALADHLSELLAWLRPVTTGFIEADMQESTGNLVWASLIRDLVESGRPPATVDSLYAWMARDVRPPWIDEATWLRMGDKWREETLTKARLAYEQQLERIERLRTPPWEKDETWLWSIAAINPAFLEDRGRFSDSEISEYREHMEHVQAEYEAKWSHFLETQSIYKFGTGDDLTEAFVIYLFGLEGAEEYGLLVDYAPDGDLLGAVVTPNQTLLERQEFVGSVGPPDQYIDLGDPKLPLTDVYLSGHVHYNLCGQLATSVTMGLDPVDGLAGFGELLADYSNQNYTDGTAILGDPGMGTSAQNLSDFMELYGWNGEPIGYAQDTQAWLERPPTPDEVSDMLEQGRAVIALVGLDTTSGYLVPDDLPGDAAHWVSILQTVETQGGEEIVRVYNPYMNREEWYSWQHLQETWELGSKLDRWGDPLGPNYRGVIGIPSAELMWLPTP